jgi:peptidoglycan/xylan/chitin deacetylase (PgdA/CDA1 family)
VLVTFDDGDRTVLDVAAPMLYERGVPGVAFVVAGLLDTDQPYWWDEVAELVENGGRVGVEQRAPAAVVALLKRVPDDERRQAIDDLRASARRPAGRTTQLRARDLLDLEEAGIAVGNHTLTHPCLPRCSDEQVRSEVVEAHRLLSDALGHPPRAFAYPNGDWDGRAREALSAEGYGLGVLFDHRLARWPLADPLRVSRLRVNSTTPMPRFRTILSGLHPAVHHARGRR